MITTLPLFVREAVSVVTPALFERFQSAEDYATAELKEIETYIQSTGFFRNKAKNIRNACRAILKHHDGEVPRTLDELVQRMKDPAVKTRILAEHSSLTRTLSASSLMVAEADASAAFSGASQYVAIASKGGADDHPEIGRAHV